MKKWSLALTAAALLLALAACQGKEEPAPRPYETGDLQAIEEAGAFSEALEELDGDTAFALYKLADYGLSREDLVDCAVLRSAGATCEEGAVLVFDELDQEQADQVPQALKDYVQQQIDANVDYRPAEIPKLENALIQGRGNSFLLAIANDGPAAQAAVDALDQASLDEHTK